jgi:hypothetical protein
VSIPISSTFPTLDPRAGLADFLESFGLTPSLPTTELLNLGERTWEAFEAIANLLLNQSGEVPLLQSIPSLSQDLDAPLPLEVLRPRTRTRMSRSQIETWQDIAARSPAALSSLSLYQTQLVQVVALAAQRGAALAARATSVGPSPAPSEDGKPGAQAEITELHLLARWAQSIAGAATIGEVADSIAERPLPDDVAAALTSLRGVPLSDITGSTGSEAFTSAFRAFVEAAGGEREVAILRGRLGFQPETLEAIAQTCGLTRERVRQLQLNAESKLRELARNGGAPEVHWRALELRRRLGVSIRLESSLAQQLIQEQVAALAAAERGFAAKLMLWLAGPYHLDRDTGWIHADGATVAGPPPHRNFLADFTDDTGRVNIVNLRNMLSELGLVSAAQEDWLEHESTLRKIGDTYFLWHGTVADKAKVVLEALGVAATAEQINDIIDEGHNTRAIRGRLLSDERFIRTDKSRIGLRTWGLDEYTGIVDEIAEEIDSLGGDADVRAVVASVAERFKLPATSVELYTGVPRFVNVSGRIRLRRPNEPYVPRRAVVDEPECYVLDDSRCVIRFLVDRDTLRGSGRFVPQGLGAWLRVLPGARRLFDSAGEHVLVSWPDSALLGPSLGSVRRPILAAGGVEGDHALLTFDRDAATVDVAVITQSALDGAEGWERLSLYTGLPASDEEELGVQLAAAVGATTTADLRARLRARGEHELAAWLPHREDPELDEALNRLRTVL